MGGSQAEWSTVASVVQSTGLAIASMAEAAEGLTVNRSRMQENLESTRGTVFAEKAALLLSRKIGRERAHQMLEEATDPRQLRDRTLAGVLARQPEIQGQISHKILSRLEDPQDYLGVARKFSERLCGPSKRRPRRRK